MEAITRFIETLKQPQRPINAATHNVLALIFWSLLAFAIVAMLLPRGAWALDACYTGSWYDPAAPGEGISVEVLDDVVLVYFYRADVQWFAFQGTDEALTAYQPWAGEIHDVGDGYFIPSDENHAAFGYDILLDLRDVTGQRPIPWCLRWDCADAMQLTRLTQPIPCE